jgi:hypothetical protein
MDMGEFAGYSEDQQVYRMQLHVRNSLSLFRSSQYLQAVYIRKLLGISAAVFLAVLACLCFLNHNSCIPSGESFVEAFSASHSARFLR